VTLVHLVGCITKKVSHMLKTEAQLDCITQGSKFFLRQMAVKRPYSLAD